MIPMTLTQKIWQGIGSLTILSVLIGGCGQGSRVEPRHAVPGYNASLIFEETFDGALSRWTAEGLGQTEITDDGRLRFTGTPGAADSANTELDLVLWLRQEFGDSFLLEYEVEFPNTPGKGSVLFCAQDATGHDLLDRARLHQNQLPNWGETLQGYEISMHCYTPNGQHNPGSKIKKYPGPYLLAKSPSDPCEENRGYLVDVVKTGSRIQLFVDNQKVHDLRDRGGFGQSYKEGYIGFLFQGASHAAMLVDNVRLFKLNPR